MEAAATEGPPCFQCPEEFAARRFAPGPPFSPETLQGTAKHLLLIRAPADFPPESLNGHTVPLLGFHILKTCQPDGREKTYKIQRCLEDLDSCARLLLPSGHQDSLTCAPVFSGSLSIREKYGDPSAPQPLFPVTHGLVPHIPEGLRQRFLPFGCQLKRSLAPWEAAEKASQKKKKKKRHLQRLEENGNSEQLLLSGESVGSAGEPKGKQTRARHHPHPQKGAGQEEAEAGGVLPGLSASKQLLGWDPKASNHFRTLLDRDLLSGETEDPARRNSKKKKKKMTVGTDGGQETPLRDQEAECELCLWGELEPDAGENAGLLGLGQHKKKKQQSAAAEGPEDPATLWGETVRRPLELSCLESLQEDNVASAKEDPGGQFPTGGKKKKKKKKEEKAVEEPLPEQDAETQFLEPNLIMLDLREGDAQETPWGQKESVEAPDQKHKRKKKKLHHKGEEDGGRTGLG